MLDGEYEFTFRDEHVAAHASFIAKSKALAPQYRTELLIPRTSGRRST